MIEAPSYDLMISKLRFDPETGEIRHMASGSVAGTISASKGYRNIGMNYRIYRAHRLMWFFVYGEWPGGIDHINGDKLDNRISNLRKASHRQNQCNRSRQSNNTSGFKGVSFHKGNNKWVARIGENGKRILLGYFDDRAEASAAYAAAAPRYHGEFARID